MHIKDGAKNLITSALTGPRVGLSVLLHNRIYDIYNDYGILFEP